MTHSRKRAQALVLLAEMNQDRALHFAILALSLGLGAALASHWMG